MCNVSKEYNITYINVLKYMYVMFRGGSMEFEKKFNMFIKENNGIFTYEDMIQSGLSRTQIRRLENDQIIKREGRGIYNHKDYLPDIMKIYQMTNKKMIYSNETAAYLHDLTERFPRIYTVTTESGYHLRKSNELKVYYCKKQILELGVIEIENNSGNSIRAYDKERTICDIIKNKERIEQQVYFEVIQNYFKGKTKLNKLSEYAKKLGISNKVMNIVELMLKP